MDKFKTIHYENFEEGDITNNFEEDSQPKNTAFEHASQELYERKPVYRKLNIIYNDTEELSSISSSDSIENNQSDTDPTFSIDLYSSAPFTSRKPPENKYFDSETMTSFNNINDLYNENYAGNTRETSMNDGIIENMKLEVDDSKNILKSNLEKINDREDKLQEIEEKSKFLIENAEKFKRKSRTLYYYMFIKYLWHTIGITMVMIIIIIVTTSLVRN
jgi:hypothetical protein